MFIRLYRWFVILLLALFFACMATPAHADGGAPNLAYVAGGNQGVSVIDVAQQKVARNIGIAGEPHTILLSLDARFLFVTQPQLNRLTILAAKTGETICSVNVAGQPSLLALDANFNKLFTAGNGASSVSEIDPTNCAIKHTFQTSGPVYGLAVAAVGSAASGSSGNQLWIASGNALTVFDDSKYNQIATVNIADGPRYVSIPPGATVYATTQKGDVVAIDLNSRKVIPLISGGKYGPMDFNEVTGEIYVPDQQHNKLIVLAPVNAGFPPPHEPSRSYDLGVEPESVAITNDGQLGFVALAGGDVAMLDLPGHELINTIHVGGAPRFIITGMYPPAVGTTPQQASIWGTVANVAAYVLVIGLLIIPIFLFRKYAKARSTDDKKSS
ncbi:hypothetical protein EPA93_26180 [Ktedonosporobacter rubrisoli]|uniref:YncE family protein n=1 Tax=Ktedonosporobacter rubrisoli TaxID=2509675 RepID=A0A4P6JV55_KTERU|nr:hypothetical protein [Ktedonosporobacter rubrisoli]QBD79285.1 hypothetical protein EPA93_26180 [Ktedonosporobacter rubrisoli]